MSKIRQCDVCNRTESNGCSFNRFLIRGKEVKKFLGRFPIVIFESQRECWEEIDICDSCYKNIIASTIPATNKDILEAEKRGFEIAKANVKISREKSGIIVVEYPEFSEAVR